jgi:hypothetical protein
MRPKRFLRLVLTLFLVLAFVGYFAFSTFVFSPTEGDYEPDISTLVPRNVDFFVAKARLSQDFGRFPRLAAQTDLEATPAWRAFLASEDYAALRQKVDIEAALTEIEAQIAQLKGIDPLHAFGGRDLALAGWVRGPDLAQADWAAYGRVNWIGKLGASLLRHPSLLGLSDRGLTVAVEDDHVALSGGELPRRIFVTRLRDVVVLGTTLELVRGARDLEARAGQDSLGQSAVYDEQIQGSKVRSPERDELELFVDWRSVSEKAKLAGRWPDPQSTFPMTALAARYFQLGSIKDLAGVIGFDRGLRSSLHASFSSEMVGPAAEKLYRQRGSDVRQILYEAAALAPADTGLFAFVHIGIGDLLRQFLDASEPALRANLDDLVRGTGKYAGTEALIAELDALFRGRVALIVRRNDYPVDVNSDPPNDGAPVFAVAVVLWTDGSPKAQGKIGDLRRLIAAHQGSLGLQGREPGKGGVYSNILAKTGNEVWEYWSPLIPGTGHLADMIDNDLYIISNSFRMLSALLETLKEPTSSNALVKDVTFQGLAAEGLQHANALVWVAPRQLAETAQRMSEQAASDTVLGTLDMARERTREEALMLRQEFGGKRAQELAPDEKARLDELVEARMTELQSRMTAEQVPALQAAYLRRIQYAELCKAALWMVSFDPKWMDMTLGVVAPLGNEDSDSRP